MKITVEIETQKKGSMQPMIHQIIRQGIERHNATVILHELRPGPNHEEIGKERRQ